MERWHRVCIDLVRDFRDLANDRSNFRGEFDPLLLFFEFHLNRHCIGKILYNHSFLWNRDKYKTSSYQNR